MNIAEKLEQIRNLTDDEFRLLIETDEYDAELFERADRVRRSIYGDKVYIRGLIEISNYCKNNCYYCGIRSGNKNVVRYRLDREDILACCETGYNLGFRTFVMQGGEDNYYTDEIMCGIISGIKEKYPDCAVTLSLGEKSRETYEAYFAAGADRYLLRHETAESEHYSKLHPENMKLETRKKCLFDLKEIGFQTGAGFMVGSPYQTTDNIISDLHFLRELQPDMIGVGPFLTHKETPFADFANGSMELTLRLLAILRLMFPRVLLPSTTALGTIHPEGREMGLKAGANVVMPNLSPVNTRKLYELYENKICTDEEAAESLELLRRKVEASGYRIVVERGDAVKCKN